MTWEPDVFALTWGNLGVKYSVIYFVVAFVLAYTLFAWQVLRAGGVVDDAVEFVSLGVLGAVVGGRVGSLLTTDWARLQAGEWRVVLQGGFSLHGATLGVCLALYLYARLKHVSFSDLADRFAFSAAASALMVALVQFFGSESVGRESHVAWAMRFPRFDTGNDMHAPLRHPAQLYDAGAALLVLGGLLVLDRLLGEEKRPRGVLAGAFVLSYFAARACVDLFREPEGLWRASGLSLAGVFSLLFVGAGAWLLSRSLRRRAPAEFAPLRSPGD